MSFSSDREAVYCLSSLILARDFTVDVCFEDGEVIASDLTCLAKIFEAVTATSDPVHVVLRAKNSARSPRGLFVVLAQDDPDCLVVDHSSYAHVLAIMNQWSAVADAV